MRVCNCKWELGHSCDKCLEEEATENKNKNKKGGRLSAGIQVLETQAKMIDELRERLESALNTITGLEKDKVKLMLKAKQAEGREKIAIGIAKKHQATVKELRAK